jgi:hypothetical protein
VSNLIYSFNGCPMTGMRMTIFGLLEPRLRRGRFTPFIEMGKRYKVL